MWQAHAAGEHALPAADWTAIVQLQPQVLRQLTWSTMQSAAYTGSGLHLLPGLGIEEQLQVTTGRQIALLTTFIVKCL